MIFMCFVVKILLAKVNKIQNLHKHKRVANSELKSALEKAFSIKDRLVFVDVYVDPAEHVYPMLIANHSLEDMWLSKDKKT